MRFDYAEFEKIGFILCWNSYFTYTFHIRAFVQQNNLNGVRNQKTLLYTRFDRDQLYHVQRVLISWKTFYFQNFSVLNLVFV